jgi:HAD superfamily hydrolase (TIGR01509 family)
VSAVPFRAVVFDLDGTVVDSHRFTFDAFRRACTPVREPPTDAEVFAAFGPSERIILERLLPAPEVDAAYARLQAHYRAHARGLDVHPAVRPLLADLQAAGIRCGLFTGRGADSTTLLLETLGLAPWFDAVIAGEQAGRPKPAPDGVLRLAAVFSVSPASVLVVGDSPLDVAAAQAAGAAAAFAAWHPWAGVRIPDGVPVIAHPDALRPLLGLQGRGSLGGATAREPRSSA